MGRAYSVDNIKHLKNKLIPFTGQWAEAFGQPDFYGTWFVWGKSGNGKTSFALQLCKELAKFGRVAYDSMEEGTAQTMVNSILRVGLDKNFILLDCENIEDLDKRLRKKKSPDFVIIDSFQYSGLNFTQYMSFAKRHPHKLLIFISQADGDKPLGKSADRVAYSANEKILVQNYRAICKGRSTGVKGYYVIWAEREKELWGE